MTKTLGASPAPPYSGDAAFQFALGDMLRRGRFEPWRVQCVFNLKLRDLNILLAQLKDSGALNGGLAPGKYHVNKRRARELLA